MLPRLANLWVKSQRQANDLYDAERAATFRSRLDRRLYDRYHTPVAWEVTPTEDAAATPCPRAA